MAAQSALQVRVKGTVQGVGFRPTVWRLAHESAIQGQVLNDAEGVLIHAQGQPEALDRFLKRLVDDAPPLANIESLDVSKTSIKSGLQNFSIIDSQSGKNRIRISADAATCKECIEEFSNPNERRYQYPFTNCTHCGPRLTIIKDVPYDRSTTTMADFPMCEACRCEYTNPADRRFHAQPIACHQCGPRIWLEDSSAKVIEAHSSGSVLLAAVQALKRGQIVAIRGIGGFHLAVDAENRDAVHRLRQRKRRYAKPFALMVDDLSLVKKYCRVSAQEFASLNSVEAPIVLLERRTDQGADVLPEQISPSSSLLGFMRAYSPLHIMLCRQFGAPLVMTSGNLSEQPQVTSLENARQGLSNIADFMLMHDRDIANRIDDSVVRMISGKLRLLRRARGYAPRALPLPPGFADAPDMLAYGGELKSTFCMLKDGAAIVSQHQGDLEDATTFDDYEKNLELYRAQYDHQPEYLAADMHPEYISTKLAVATAESKGLSLYSIQHHHAHIASCLADNAVPLSTGPVLGIALDGLGYGSNHQLWGGEFLLADYRSSTRLASLQPVAMIGGAMAIKEPWRNVYAYIDAYMGWVDFDSRFSGLDLHSYLSSKPLSMIDKMLANGVAVPEASSCGRLFDAVAAALDLSRDQAQFEGQGAIELEMLVDQPLLSTMLSGQRNSYQLVAVHDQNKAITLSAKQLWLSVLDDIQQGKSKAYIATAFHAGLALSLADTASSLSQENLFDTVALSGGCLQNRVLSEALENILTKRGYRVLSQTQYPANDGGLSLGQAVIAAAQHIQKNTPIAKTALQ